MEKIKELMDEHKNAERFVKLSFETHGDKRHVEQQVRNLSGQEVMEAIELLITHVSEETGVPKPVIMIGIAEALQERDRITKAQKDAEDDD